MTDLEYLLGDPDEVTTWRGRTTAYGGPIKGSRRSIAHLVVTDAACQERFGVKLGVYQSAYNVGVEASAGTHDKDAVYDVYIPDVEWLAAQRFLRELGWAAWYRYPPTFSAHIHMISLGYTTPVGVYVPGQVDDYYRGALGLKGQHNSGDDPTWHPADIDSTIFDYPAWKAAQEDDMFSDEDRAKLEATLTAVKALTGDERDRAKETRERDRRLAQGIRKAVKSRTESARNKILEQLAAELEQDDESDA